MKQQPFNKPLHAALAFVLISIMAIVSTGMVSATPAGRPASLLEDCTPAPGVVIKPPYASGFVACAVGNFKGLPAGIGAITFKKDDPNTLLVATYADTKPAMIYSVSVLRNADNHITGLNTSGTLFANAPYADAGLAYGPGDILFYSRWPNNEIGEFKPGSTSPDRVIPLSTFSIPTSVAGLNFVPAGFAHEGELKLFTYQTGDWYAAALSPEADGTYSIASATNKAKIIKYSETFTYVPPSSSPFADYSAMLVSEYYNGVISAYTLDAESNPVPSSKSAFLSGLSYVKGSTIDPLTGDMLLSGPGTRVTAIRGFGTQPWVPTPTPTATTPPPQTYSITGRVTDTNGSPVYKVDVEIPGLMRSTTDTGGNYYFFQLPAGTYTIKAQMSGYSISPGEYTVTVPPDTTRDFTAQQMVSHPPVILVHGWLGQFDDTGDSCSRGVTHSDTDTDGWFDGFPQWLTDDGFDVWIAHWDTSPWWTAPVEANGGCIAKEIETVKKLTGKDRVILIAHSMGGPVSRSYLQSQEFAARKNVDTLITMGSPHAGINGIDLVIDTPLALYCIDQPAVCEMDPDYMMLFNGRSERNDVKYYFIGGDGGADGGGGPLGGALYTLNGPNDGLVSRSSATGKYFSWSGTAKAVNHWVNRYQTHEDHLRHWGTWYFEPAAGQTLSDSYKCVREILLSLDRTDCTVEPEAPAFAQEQNTSFVLAPKQSGHIATGETTSRTLSIDSTGKSIFTLTWAAQTLSMSLVDPNGLTIDPDYAMLYPSIVTFDSGPADNGMPGWITYTFANTVPGDWRLNVSAPDAGPDGVDWTAIASFASDRMLQVTSDASFYRIGDTATFTATLANGTAGITGATVSAELTRPDSVTDTLALTDVGDGRYQGTYTIPNAPGYVGVIVTAHGNDGGVAFSRQASQLLSIMPQTAQLTGSYADRAVDEDGDGRADALSLDMGINVSKPGDYNLSADIMAGDQVVAQFSKVFIAAAGSQVMTLRFNGRDIYNAGLDGPYVLTNLVLVDLTTALPTIMESDLYTTEAYKYTQFMPIRTLYLPMIKR